MYYFNGDSLILCLNRIPETFTVDTFGAIYFLNERREPIKVLLPTDLFRVYDPEKDIYVKGPSPDEFTDIDFIIGNEANFKMFKAIVKNKLLKQYGDISRKYFKEA